MKSTLYAVINANTNEIYRVFDADELDAAKHRARRMADHGKAVRLVRYREDVTVDTDFDVNQAEMEANGLS